MRNIIPAEPVQADNDDDDDRFFYYLMLVMPLLAVAAYIYDAYTLLVTDDKPAGLLS